MAEPKKEKSNEVDVLILIIGLLGKLDQKSRCRVMRSVKAYFSEVVE